MTDNDMIRRGDARAAIQLGDTVTKMQARIASIPAVDADPVCTDCGGSGITYQTERRCACQTSIPAVQPTVKPLGADGVKIHPQDILNAAWRDDLGDEGLAMYARILSALDMQPTVSPELLATTHDVAALVDAFDKIEAAQRDTGQEFPTAAWLEFRAALARVKGETK